MKTLSFEFYQNRLKELVLLVLAITLPISLISKNHVIVYYDMIAGQFAGLLISVIRYYMYYYKKDGSIIELFLLVGFVVTIGDMVFRLHSASPLSNLSGGFTFSLVFIFLYRRLKIPILKNALFLICYSSFYCILNFKFLKFDLLSVLFTIPLSVVFAYALLVTAKSKVFFFSTYCGALSIFCLTILGRRLVNTYENSFLIVQFLCSILFLLMYIAWPPEEKYEVEKLNKKKFFDIQLLPNMIGVSLFIIYVFGVNLNAITIVWGLLFITTLWYAISIVRGFKNDSLVIDMEEDIIRRDQLTHGQIARLERYSRHLTTANYLKKKTIR